MHHIQNPKTPKPRIYELKIEKYNLFIKLG